MSTSEFAEFLPFAHQLADSAGDILRDAFRKLNAVESKEDGSPVTAIDRASERRLRELINARYPHHGIIGEEYPAERTDAELVWILDPIDGTRPFIGGVPVFGVLIALMRGDEFVLGVVDQSHSRDRWVGCDGWGAQLNGQAIPPRACSSLDQAMLSTSGPLSHSQAQWKDMEPLHQAADRVVYGAECLSFGLVGMGCLDVVVDAGLKLYDFAAPEAVMRNAGAMLTDWQGRRLDRHSDGRVLGAGDARVHAEALKVLAGR